MSRGTTVPLSPTKESCCHRLPLTSHKRCRQLPPKLVHASESTNRRTYWAFVATPPAHAFSPFKAWHFLTTCGLPPQSNPPPPHTHTPPATRTARTQASEPSAFNQQDDRMSSGHAMHGCESFSIASGRELQSPVCGPIPLSNRNTVNSRVTLGSAYAWVYLYVQH